jgi:hypothetical protein
MIRAVAAADSECSLLVSETLFTLVTDTQRSRIKGGRLSALITGTQRTA